MYLNIILIIKNMSEIKCISTHSGHLERLLWTNGELFLVNTFSELNENPKESNLVCFNSSGSPIYQIKYKVEENCKRSGAEFIGNHIFIY